MNSKHSLKIAAVLAAALMLTGAVMTGCGSKSDSSATTTTAAATTQVATQAATQAAAGSSEAQNSAKNQQSSQSSDADSQSSNSDSGNTEEKRGNITKEEAGSIALGNVPYGNEITIVESGFYNGEECWVVGVADTTGKIYTCYVTSVICEVQGPAGGNSDSSVDAVVDE
ncbi:hypothetical protein [Lachnoclostridium sp. MSJ-17]|uniref:hypothetical protein n=1 Tax=Lachnoclostridium sp. MSJ-17 TaxID=2841516 RepID=UPI001C1285AA|nr:hypothetical protein [Lachnoclostridium sp. MSJ-17]MBU5462747.1 hypothetical protein [Lachnoclostridium sp. MSJ-17]